MTTITFEEDLFRDPALPADHARTMLAALFASGAADAAIQAYRAVRAFVWNALGARTRDDLHDWHDVIRATSRRLEEVDEELSVKTRAFSELIYLSIGHWEANPAEDAMQREHVPEILDMLAETPDGRLPRAQIRERLRIGDPNMSRVLSLMTQAGLIERERKGKTVFIRRSAEAERREAERERAAARDPLPEADRPASRFAAPAGMTRIGLLDRRTWSDRGDPTTTRCPVLADISNVAALQAASNIGYLVVDGEAPSAVVAVDRSTPGAVVTGSVRWTYAGIAYSGSEARFVQENAHPADGPSRPTYLPMSARPNPGSGGHGW